MNNEAAMSFSGFLGSYLAKGLKTNQLEVNTDEKTLRPIARLKEPRDLFALPKDKDNDYSQQAPRWPIECQVIEERVVHIPYVPPQPEPYNQPTGNEPKPRPVGEENGIVVFNYNPISAVNYEKPVNTLKADSSDSDISSSESRGSTPECSTPDRRKLQLQHTFSKLLESLQPNSSSNSNDDDDELEEDRKYLLESLMIPAPGVQRLKGGADVIDPSELGTDTQSSSFASHQTLGIGESRSVSTSNSLDVRAKVITPVRFDAGQLARIELSNARASSSSSSVSTDYNDTMDTDDDGSTTVRPTNAPQSKSISDAGTQLSKFQLGSASNVYMQKPFSSKIESPSPAQNQVHSATMNSSLEATENKPNANENSKSDDNKDSINDSDSPLQFSRSATGGSRILTNCHPYNPDEYDGLEFESRFESGNLAKAVKITDTYYELYLRSDLYTSRSKQWFYFRVRRTKKNIIYRFSIVNLVKCDSLYNDGMRPLMYSTMNARNMQEGWRRCGENVVYYRNDDENISEDDEENSSYTLTFNIEFPNDNDTVYFAHSYPYTYSDLQDYLIEIQKNPAKSKFCKLRLLCRTLAGNNVYYLTVTAPTPDEESMKRKKSIVVSARVHPSETPSSWMMKGLMDFITGDSVVAKRLRHKFIFKLIPMLNPDGVIVGNTRNSLTGKDLNRQYRTVIRETYPSIWYTKAMIKRLIDECGVAMYCDMHAHSRKHNIFIYGCENRRNSEKKLTEQVFPLMMHKNVADKFSFENCKFKVQRSKEGTGRIVVWMLGILNSYTIEASFGGSSLGQRKGTHFNTAERLRLKIIERLLKEGSSADEPLNIPLSDYSSDEGDSSSSSDNEGKASLTFSDLEGPCCAPLKAPPCSPEYFNVRQKQRIFKRMRKVMQFLDRVYFQRVYQKRIQAAVRAKRRKDKKLRLEKRFKHKETTEAAEKTDGGEKRLEGGQELIKNVQWYKAAKARCQYTQLQYEQAVATGCIFVNKKKKHKRKKDDGSHHGENTNTSSNPNPNQNQNSNPNQSSTPNPNPSPNTNPNPNPNPIIKRRVRVSRKLRLWLATKKIMIYRQRKKHKKHFSKVHAPRKREDPQRTPLDLPTTDPGSDLHFSTDDEAILEARILRDCGVSGVPRPRHYLMQSELQRRYIEEIGDGTDIIKRMPPELIITSPTKQNPVKITYKPAVYKPLPAASQLTTPPILTPTPLLPPPDRNLLSAFPLITEIPRRTSSWHNLHNNAKCIPKIKAQSPHQRNSPFEGQTKEDLQFRLSLRKKVWSNIKSENNQQNNTDPNRSIPWKVSAMFAQTKREKQISSVIQQQTQKKDENELLFTACSQKLLAWQKNAVMLPGKRKSKVMLNLVIPNVSNEDEKTVRIFKQVSRTRMTQKLPTKTESKESKARRKKNPLSKMADAAQVITRLTKNRSNQSLAVQRQVKSVNMSAMTTTTAAAVATTTTTSASHRQPVNKFKTGGIVATAVQSSTTKRNRPKLRALTANNNKTANSNNNTNSNIITTTKHAPKLDVIVPICMRSVGSASKVNVLTTFNSTVYTTKLKVKSKKKRNSDTNADTPSVSTTVSAATKSDPAGGGGASGAGVTKKPN